MITGKRPHTEIVSECRRIVALAEAHCPAVRVLGRDTAVLRPAGTVAYETTGQRLDIVTTRGGGDKHVALLAGDGHAPYSIFNMLHGTERPLALDPVTARKLNAAFLATSQCVTGCAWPTGQGRWGADEVASTQPHPRMRRWYQEPD